MAEIKKADGLVDWLDQRLGVKNFPSNDDRILGA